MAMRVKAEPDEVGVKKRSRVTTWSEYDRALAKRGTLTTWFDDARSWDQLTTPRPLGRGKGACIRRPPCRWA